jgi:O-acetyl-ADP-ribose deacetylase (regulator of RNase III)
MMTTTVRAANDDITALNVDAVVNAANSTLLGGGGVDGAIHDAAGPELYEACTKLGGCEAGDAKITNGYQMRSRFIIHAVGPIWWVGTRGEPVLLASCYTRSLQLATDQNVKSIAFPSISTGAFRYPIEFAAPIAVAKVLEFVSNQTSLEEVVFCCFSSEDFAIYRKLLGKTERGSRAQ